MNASLGTMDITNGRALSHAISDKSAPLRQYLEAAFPHSRPLQKEYRASVGELVVDSRGATASTIGTATDLMIRFLVDPENATVSARRYVPLSDSWVKTVDELALVACEAIKRGPGYEVVVARAVWGLALLVQLYRSGQLGLQAMMDLAPAGAFNTKRMLLQASGDALDELVEIRSLAEAQLLPFLARPFHISPEFDSSVRGKAQRIAAEADLICGGLLLDVKTRLGTPHAKTRVRSDTLKVEDLYQLIAYALLDHSDSYSIQRVGIYSARYGALVSWPLAYAAETMAGKPIDFSACRQDIWDMLYE